MIHANQLIMRGALLALTLTAPLACGRSYAVVREVPPASPNAGPSAAEAEMAALLERAAASPIAADYFGKLFKAAVLVLEDADDATYTVRIDDGRVRLERGTHTSEPDLIIPLRRDACENLVRILSDGKVDEAEGYTIHVATYVPGLRRVFRSPSLTDPDVIDWLGLPDVIHTSLQNPGAPTGARATIVNAAGQWLVFPGHIGDPWLTMSLTQVQANALMALVFAPMPEDDLSALKARLDAIRSLLDEVTVSRRQDG